MTKQEFLERLRLSLNGKVPPGQVVENLQFYEDYINTEIRKGTEETEVLARLGDPRLIARTIVETQAGGQSGNVFERAGYGKQEPFGGTWYEDETAEDGSWQEESASGQWYAQGEEPGEGWYGNREAYEPYDQPGERHLRLLSRIPVWAWILFVLLIIVLAVSAVFSLLAAILPILLPILIVLFLVKVFREWLH